MPCMCGDICCPSCGPAQGNWQCPLCRAWASEGCVHITDDGANIKPEFREEVERIEKAKNDQYDAMAKDLEDDYNEE